MSIEEREKRLKRHVAAKTIVRGKWLGCDESGRATACLLAAWSPEAGAAESAARCPADVMPLWLARCTIDIDDGGSEALWWSRVERYAAVIRRVVELPPERLVRLDYEFRAVALREARAHAGPSEAVVDRVLALCDRVAIGRAVADSEWAPAAAAAAAWSAWSAAGAAGAAAGAAGAAAWPAAVWSAAGWSGAAEAAAAASAAWDRILDEWLTAMERAV